MMHVQFLRPVLVLTLACCLLPNNLVQAQQGSDVSGALPQSDISGALNQGDQAVFDTEVVEYRMSGAARALVQALQEETLSTGVDGEKLSVSPTVVTLLVEGGSQQGELARQHFVQALTARGLPDARARALGQDVSGLLSEGEVDPGQFLQTLQAFNEAADVAPEEFRLHPPEEFVLVRTVLRTLLHVASIESQTP